jgi:hypothetical protein
MDSSNGYSDISGQTKRPIGILIIFFLLQRSLKYFIKKIIEGKNAG